MDSWNYVTSNLTFWSFVLGRYGEDVFRYIDPNATSLVPVCMILTMAIIILSLQNNKKLY